MSYIELQGVKFEALSCAQIDVLLNMESVSSADLDRRSEEGGVSL
jgi:hypothetical protein